ncbi:nickel transporter permease [Desulfosporosinus meridiei]|uniref:ABC-type dipeptide/oligopeptide/nickel transport system, permease component n=1 Tax=Desulfosporosinus meridiei (strain ATCC BAA-275 / DSM 13257 / KCTC 12902 / NCIMB 13706 / S10) TaxID=768704 RepID=J7ILC7_DESMD|nr:nickel transporter permease [Desulfosporosinus meridiei]AFQ42602.1 ABC-type dipeptide/oligopeptide/nickel transport system, permease component [Desulfosporosinus meridiei DSM 13257]
MKLKNLLRDPLALLGLILIVVILAVAIMAPWLAPHDPLQFNTAHRLEGPSASYPLGTDHLGRCILSRILFGAGSSLSIAFLVLGLTLSVGTLVGTLAGYVGGKLDDLIISIIDVLLAFPGLILALVIAGMLGPSITNVMIALAAVQWVGYARIIRALVASMKEKEYVQAARAGGGTHLSLVLRHILPNVLSPVIVLATLDMGSTILAISGMSYLGLGAQPPDPEWGAMLNDGRPYMYTAPATMIFPGLAILITVLAFNLLGDGLRDLFDPREVQKQEKQVTG